MKSVLPPGILIGVMCSLWMFVMGVTGWYKDPSHAGPFFVILGIEVAGLIWGLRQTAGQGRTYSGQVVAGALMSMIAALIIVGGSLIFTNLAFPEYVEEIAAVNRRVLQQQGKPESEIAAEIAAWSDAQTPARQAFNGFAGTFTTGVLITAVVAVWVRARGA